MGSPDLRRASCRLRCRCVALVLRSVAVILGKTVTVAFAGIFPPTPPPPTPQPGASAGRLIELLASSVADTCCRRRSATQTGGSVLPRPPIAAWSASAALQPVQSRGHQVCRPRPRDTIGLLQPIDDVELIAASFVGSTAQADMDPRPRLGVAARRSGTPRSRIPCTRSRIRRRDWPGGRRSVREIDCRGIFRVSITPAKPSTITTRESWRHWATHSDSQSQGAGRRIRSLRHAHRICPQRLRLAERCASGRACFDGVDVILSAGVKGEALRA